MNLPYFYLYQFFEPKNFITEFFQIKIDQNATLSCSGLQTMFYRVAKLLLSKLILSILNE